MEYLKIKADDSLDRLDVFLADRLEGISRTKIQKMIKSGEVKVNGKKEKSSYIIQNKDIIGVTIIEEKEPEIKPENLNLDIIYEDNYIAVVNKPRDMVVHPAPGHYSGTLVNGLLYQLDKLSNLNGEIRPGIVHRLDKGTSGLLVVAKDNESHKYLSEQFKERTVKREYIALVHGEISKEKETIIEPIGRHPVRRQKMAVIEEGREAISHYEVLERFENYTLIKVNLETGRTHQIRVHLNHINYPIVGDPVYSSGKNEFKLKEQFLHARKLSFIHPETKTKISFNGELPNNNKQILEGLRRKKEGMM